MIADDVFVHDTYVLVDWPLVLSLGCLSVLAAGIGVTLALITFRVIRKSEAAKTADAPEDPQDCS